MASTAHAEQPVPPRKLGIRWQGLVPHLSFSARDVASSGVRKKLQSGLPQTLVMRVYAFREGGRPVAVTARSCRIVYDLWEEVYRVEAQTPHDDRSSLVRSIDEVLDRCVVARQLPVGVDDDWEGRSDQNVYFAVLVEFNPMSQHTVERIRRWLARPAGGGGFEGEAFFGSFVSLFVNRRLGDAERAIRFRSQPTSVP
ncbi:MAG: hypothetical protein ACOC97_05585 [Myxococcota bacterium]